MELECKNPEQRRQLLEAIKNADANFDRIGLFIGTGFNRGVYGGGQVTALERAGFRDVFSIVGGFSTGLPTSSYFLPGQAVLGTSIYHEECTTSRFINFWRALTRRGPLVDVAWITDVFRGKVGNKGLDLAALQQHPATLYTVLTLATGESRLVNLSQVVTNEAELFAIVQAAISAPFVSPPVMVPDYGLCLDGGISNPLPIKEMMALAEPPTHLLILANRPRDYEPPWYEKLALWLGTLRYPKKLRTAALRRQEVFAENLRYLREEVKIPWGIIWTDAEVKSLCRDPKKLKAASLRAEQHLYSLLTTD